MGGHYSYNSTSQEFYNSENSGTSYLAKIGLMYVSDYGYAAPPNYWTTSLGNYNSVSANNWMYTNSYEWTITPSASNTNYAYSIISGNISENPAYGFSYAVRPCFYLNSDVAYISGDGSQENPFRID